MTDETPPDGTAQRRAAASLRGRRGSPGSPAAGALLDPVRFLALADRPILAPLARLRLRPADRVLVEPQEAITAGQPIIEHCRETFLVEVPARGAIAQLGPGEFLQADK